MTYRFCTRGGTKRPYSWVEKSSQKQTFLFHIDANLLLRSLIGQEAKFVTIVGEPVEQFMNMFSSQKLGQDNLSAVIEK